MHLENLPIVDLIVTDEARFPGATFRGTAESIFKEMKTLNPEVFVNQTDPALLTARSLEQRQGAPVSKHQ